MGEWCQSHHAASGKWYTFYMLILHFYFGVKNLSKRKERKMAMVSIRHPSKQKKKVIH